MPSASHASQTGGWMTKEPCFAPLACLCTHTHTRAHTTCPPTHPHTHTHTQHTHPRTALTRNNRALPAASWQSWKSWEESIGLRCRLQRTRVSSACHACTKEHMQMTASSTELKRFVLLSETWPSAPVCAFYIGIMSALVLNHTEMLA